MHKAKKITNNTTSEGEIRENTTPDTSNNKLTKELKVISTITNNTTAKPTQTQMIKETQPLTKADLTSNTPRKYPSIRHPMMLRNRRPKYKYRTLRAQATDSLAA